MTLSASHSITNKNICFVLVHINSIIKIPKLNEYVDSQISNIMLLEFHNII